MTASDPSAPPAGFVPVKLGSTFATHCGQLFGRWHDGPSVAPGRPKPLPAPSGGSERGGRLQIAFRVEPHQVNPGNHCHGGMLSLFADVVLSSAAQYQTDIPRQFLPTISLQLDFMNGAPLGQWVQGEATILQVTKNLVFSQGLVTCGGKTVARASGVFRRGPLLPDSESDHRLHLPGMPDRD